MIEMIVKSNDALKQGVFTKKLMGYVFDKWRNYLLTFKKRFFKINGNRYHGQIASNYEATRIKQDSWHAETRILSKFLELLPDRINVLDVPFGTGRFLDLYDQKNMAEVRLNDLSPFVMPTYKH